MSALSSHEGDYRLARQMQDIFRDAIKAIMDNNLSQLQNAMSRLIEAHPDSSLEEAIAEFHSEGKTLLHIAANSGNLPILRTLLDYCPESNHKKLVNLKDHRGFTPFMNATISENEEMMLFLIGLGAEVNARNEDGANAIHFAAADGNIQRLKVLAEHGGQFHVQSKSGTALHWAAGKGHAEAIQFLIQHGKVDVNATSAEGIPAVIMAAVAMSDLGVKYLVEAGADIGMIVSGNLTTLHICAENGLLQAVQSIIATETGRRCCSIETTEGNNPLHLAAMVSNRDMVKLLLPVCPVAPSLTGSNEEETLHKIMEDGQVRMKKWEALHHAKQQQAEEEVNPAQHLSQTTAADSMARFEAIQCPPTSEEVRAQAEQCKDKANDFYKQGKFNEAIAKYTEAISLDKCNAVYWSNRSACYLSMKENRNALLDAETCRRLKPDWSKGCYRLAAARLAMELYEDAAVAAFEGCKLDANNEELKAIMQKAIKKGQEEHKQKMLASAGK